MTCFCQVLIETLNKEFPLHFFEEPKFCNLSSNTTLIFSSFFGSKVVILNIIMQFRYYQNCKQHVHSRLAMHTMICHSASFLARNWLNKQSRKLEGLLEFQRKILRWTTFKTCNMYSFERFRSSLNGLSKVVG